MKKQILLFSILSLVATTLASPSYAAPALEGLVGGGFEAGGFEADEVINLADLAGDLKGDLEDFKSTLREGYHELADRLKKVREEAGSIEGDQKDLKDQMRELDRQKVYLEKYAKLGKVTRTELAMRYAVLEMNIAEIDHQLDLARLRLKTLGDSCKDCDLTSPKGSVIFQIKQAILAAKLSRAELVSEQTALTLFAPGVDKQAEDLSLMGGMNRLLGGLGGMPALGQGVYTSDTKSLPVDQFDHYERVKVPADAAGAER